MEAARALDKAASKGVIHKKTAARRKYGQEHQIVAEVDRKTGEIGLYRELEVSDEIEDPALQKAFQEVGSDAVVEIIPGMAHSTHMPGHEEMLRTIAERWAEARAQ